MIIVVRKKVIIIAALIVGVCAVAGVYAQNKAYKVRRLYRDISVIVDAGHEALGEYFK